MAKQKLNPGNWHEATDRTDCVINIIQEMLLKHPAIITDKEIREKVKAAQDLLGEVYQLAGSKM